MLTRAKKEEIIRELTQSLSGDGVVVAVDYAGVGANDLVGLKRSLRELGGRFVVARKTLLLRALKEAGRPTEISEYNGQVAVAFSGADEVAAPKVLADFSKGNEKCKILGGIVGDSFVGSDVILSLSALPNKDTLRAQVVGSIASPLSGFIGVLSGTARAFVSVLAARKDKLSEA